MSRWQPIETAPRDGTSVLLFLDQSYSSVTRHLIYIGWAEGIDEFGSIRWEAEADVECGLNPTHWMPLPEPPETRP